ncbi:Uncharacterised protein [Klebsiella variicola]|nr:Uncharacterised protein [Klebsiella variicola]
MLEFRKVKAAVLNTYGFRCELTGSIHRGNYEHEPTEFQ